MKEMVGGCCVCSDERGWPDNPLVYCDGNGCTVAVHQACYGIVTVPVGPWYCRKCESPEVKGKVRCELCPSKSGALKRSDTGGWAHVVCALYIPEVRFGNVTSMEPIVLRLIPQERYNKTCYICQEQGKSHRAIAGACMQCNKSGCRQQFHVTCAQSLGLLCEEAGNYLDNVKYCGYCQHHYSKLKKGGNVKTIPPYKPVAHDSPSSDSSGEKEGAASPGTAAAAAAAHHAKHKPPGRKSSHSSSTSGKNTPNSSSSKTPTNTGQPMEKQEAPPDTPPATRRHKSVDKNKKKPSPVRRGSSAGAGEGAGAGGGSKTSTPAPSPQHTVEHSGRASGGSTPTGGGKTPAGVSPPPPPGPPPAPAPLARASDTVIAAAPAPPPATAAAVAAVAAAAPPATAPNKDLPSVITSADEHKHSKKRKAHPEHAATPPPAAVPATPAATPATQPGEGGAGAAGWDCAGAQKDVHMEPADKVIKKAKTENSEGVTSQPPPAHSPAAHPSPRHLASPMPGPSGVGNPPSNIRSPSQPQGKEGATSLLVSVPLASAAHGLNLTAHAHQVCAQPQELAGPTPHIFHQPMKQAAMEPAHSPLGARGWPGLNVAYELQDHAKPGVSGVAPGKEGAPAGGGAAPGAPPPVRNKKRAALAAVVAATTPPPPPMQSSGGRKGPQPTPPPPLYQETIKDSPPSSPNSERPLKPKLENRVGGAPHMLGNELNPSSLAAARLHEQLAAELAAHAAGGAQHDAPVPPPLINKASQSSGRGGGGGGGAQSLDQLLERQWEQGSQFLMEQAQHFDIASLLSCLHQLRTENVRLEEHVGSLLQRRDHLLAVNARLAIPLHAVSGGVTEPARCPRENGGANPRAAPPPPPPAADRTHQLIMREVQQKPS